MYVGKADRKRRSEVRMDWLLALGSEVFLLFLPRWNGELIKLVCRPPAIIPGWK